MLIFHAADPFDSAMGFTLASPNGQGAPGCSLCRRGDRHGIEPKMRSVFGRMPVHLMAGGRSRAGWDVPAWALQAAASYSELPQVGHMVMLEAPQAFAQVLVTILRQEQ